MNSDLPQPESQRRFVIVNPCAGRRRASKRLSRFRLTQPDSTQWRETSQPGDARELARRAAEAGFTQIVAAGGDGTVHEVAGGIMESQVPDVTLGVLPVGSANDFAWSLRREPAVAGGYRVDMGIIESADGKREHFIESVGLGLSGQVTVAAQRIGWLQGIPLYMLAALQAIGSLKSPRYELEIDGQSVQANTTLLSLMLGKREGSFLIAAEASLVDGAFDYVHAVDIRRWEALLLLSRIALAGLPAHSKIARGRCVGMQVRCQSDLVIHTDGEMFAVEGERVRDVRISLLPSRLRVALLG